MGGAIFNESGTVTITNSSFGTNSAFGGGAGNSQGLGGAIFTRNGSVTIASSTFSENRAAQGGGAIFAVSVATSGTGFTGGNVTLALNNSILANTKLGAADFAAATIGTGSNSFSGVGNLIESNAATGAHTGTFRGMIVSSADPKLAALADNGGPTKTFALQTGSPAIDAGDSVAGTAAGDFDQRGSGFDRVIGESIDIGAFELQVTPPDTFVVTTLDDEDDTDTSDLSDLSLREALRLANADSNASTITFASALTSGGAAQITLDGMQLLISTNVTITGPGANLLAIDGDNVSRVLLINTGATVSLTGFTIQNGNSTGYATGSEKIGGGVRNEGTLTVDNIVVTGSTANTGGGLASYGTLTVKNSTLSGNTATFSGGGLYTYNSGTTTVLNSTVSGNTAEVNGGGVYGFGTTTLLNSTVSGNKSDGQGGGILTYGPLTLHNTTVTNNHSNNDDGGGNFVKGGGLSNPDAENVTISNSIIAKNYRGSGMATADDISGDVTANYSLIGDPTGATITGSNNLNGDPLLGSLADNGGPTKTHKLSSFSPAIDAGSLALVPADTFDLDGDTDTTEKLPFDQRGVGFTRDIDFDANDGTPDMGAYEAVPTPPDTFVITTLDDARRRSTTLDDARRRSTTLDDARRRSTTLDDARRRSTTLDDARRRSTTLDDARRRSTTLDDARRRSTTLDDARRRGRRSTTRTTGRRRGRRADDSGCGPLVARSPAAGECGFERFHDHVRFEPDQRRSGRDRAGGEGADDFLERDDHGTGGQAAGD